MLCLAFLEWWGFNSRIAPWAGTKWSSLRSPVKKAPLSTDFVKDATTQSQAHLGTYWWQRTPLLLRRKRGHRSSAPPPLLPWLPHPPTDSDGELWRLERQHVSWCARAGHTVGGPSPWAGRVWTRWLPTSWPSRPHHICSPGHTASCVPWDGTSSPQLLWLVQNVSESHVLGQSEPFPVIFIPPRGSWEREFVSSLRKQSWKKVVPRSRERWGSGLELKRRGKPASLLPFSTSLSWTGWPPLKSPLFPELIKWLASASERALRTAKGPSLGSDPLQLLLPFPPGMRTLSLPVQWPPGPRRASSPGTAGETEGEPTPRTSLSSLLTPQIHLGHLMLADKGTAGQRAPCTILTTSFALHVVISLSIFA